MCSTPKPLLAKAEPQRPQIHGGALNHNVLEFIALKETISHYQISIINERSSDMIKGLLHGKKACVMGLCSTPQVY